MSTVDLLYRESVNFIDGHRVGNVSESEIGFRFSAEIPHRLDLLANHGSKVTDLHLRRIGFERRSEK